jgi:hypothetical protein
MAIQDDLEALLGGGGTTDQTTPTQAISQLILGGGKASVGGVPLFGGAAPSAIETAATQAEMGGFGRAPDPALAQAIREGRVDPASILDRPASAPVIRRLVQKGPNRQDVVSSYAPEAAPEQQPAGTFTNQAVRTRPLNPTFEDILNTADEVANSLTTRKGTVSKTLLPNPYGPGSYDPNEQVAVEKIQKQGEEQAKKRAGIDQARAFFDSGILQRLPPWADTKAIVNQVLEGAGIIKSAGQLEKEKAFGKAKGELEAGKGVKTPVPTDLLQLVGKQGFDERLTQAVANKEITDPQLQVRLEAQHQNAVRANRINDVDRRKVSDLQTSTESLNDLLKSYQETPAFKTGKFSDTLKAALATNNKATTIENMISLPLNGAGYTDADRVFAAKYNAVRASLRDFSSDTRFSDSDKADTLRGIGEPGLGPKSFPTQINAMIDKLVRKQTRILDDSELAGKDVSKLKADRAAKQEAAKVDVSALPDEGVTPTGAKFKKVNGKIQILE